MSRSCAYALLRKDCFRDPWQGNSKVGPACPDFKHTIIKNSLWIDGSYNPTRVGEECRRRGLPQPPPGAAAHEKDEASAFVASLRSCAKTKDLCNGIRVHDNILRRGLLQKCSDALITMYAKCGVLAKAKELFDTHKSRNVITWNALIVGYSQKGQSQDALKHFEQMKSKGLPPDAVTYTCALKACGNIGRADKGEQIHHEIAKQGLLVNDVVLGTALVDMYAKCGALPKARQVLEELPVRNAVSWNALIAGYAQHGEGVQALNCFEGMLREGLSPDAVTFVCILKACGSIGEAVKGEKFHDEVAKRGLMRNNIVLGNALVDMYAKCGALTKARRVLEELPVRNVISWSALIAGYAEQGEGEQALNCFEQMQHEGLCPNAVTFICILKACGSIGAVDKGEKIHDEVAKLGLLRNDIVLGTALVDMYAKCGALAKARQVLQELPVRDIISWNALIAGSVQQGEGEQALNFFEQMQGDGLSPNAVTFSCVLCACSRLGLIKDAQMYFVNISAKFGMKPNLEHHTCMVDLFGRAGYLDKAVGVIEKLTSSDTGVWSALLGACWKWGDVNVGRWAFELALQVDRSDAAVYVLMANIYAAAGMQEDAENIEAMRIENKAWKKPAQSWWIDTCGNVRSRFVEGTKHTQS